jgi:oligopeptide/dipeptide ABC transporter ATP-binding protein
MAEPLLIVEELRKHFPVRGGVLFRKIADVKAVDGVSFRVNQGETFGLVGESGCGKSTLAKVLIRLLEPTSGRVVFSGQDLATMSRQQVADWRRQIQMIFQDPFDSLNPRHTVGQILREPLDIHGIGTPAQREEKVHSLLSQVGLPQSAADRFPHEFSGGQRQRIGIARALALNPKIIICDEPVSALDVSIQSQILNLLVDLQRQYGITLVFVAHDLAAVKFISDRIAVMYLGKIVETADADELYANPKHPYTQALLRAIPSAQSRDKRQHKPIEGDIPSPMNPPPGCRFHTRCPHRMPRCSQEEPATRELKSKAASSVPHTVACHLVEAQD